MSQNATDLSGVFGRVRDYGRFTRLPSLYYLVPTVLAAAYGESLIHNLRMLLLGCWPACCAGDQVLAARPEGRPPCGPSPLWIRSPRCAACVACYHVPGSHQSVVSVWYSR